MKKIVVWEILLKIQKLWQGKAGGYAIQGRASAFVPWISGSYTGVMGFPMNEIKNVLESSGWKK